MDFIDEFDDGEDIDLEELNELTVQQHAMSFVLGCLLSALKNEQPGMYAQTVESIRNVAQSMRAELGEVNEEDIAQYAHAVAECMESYVLEEKLPH